MSTFSFTYIDSNNVTKQCLGANWTLGNNPKIDLGCDNTPTSPPSCYNVWGSSGGGRPAQPHNSASSELECMITALTDGGLTLTQRVELFTYVDAYAQARMSLADQNRQFWVDLWLDCSGTNAKGKGRCCCTTRDGMWEWAGKFETARDTFKYFLENNLPLMQVALDEEIANVGDMMEIESDILVRIEEMNRIRDERNLLLAQQQSQEQTQIAQETISATLKWALPVVIGVGILLLFTKT